MKKYLKSWILLVIIGLAIFGYFDLFERALSLEDRTPIFEGNEISPRAQFNQKKLESEQLFSQKQLNDQAVLGLNWFQQSGEYMALAYQAFNLAKITFTQAVNQGINNPAVIVDIDETVLNNSPYLAGLIGTDKGFTSSSWNDWVKAQQAQAIPGAVEFVKYVNSHGGMVFFISNRDEKANPQSKNDDLELATIANLKAVGFTGVNEETVILKGEFGNTKEVRRQAVENGQADGIRHKIVVLVGDNLNDLDALAGVKNSERRLHVQESKNRYGILSVSDNKGKIEPAYIVLPNPLYGDWEEGLYNPSAFGKETNEQLTPLEKNQQRKEALITYRGTGNRE